MKVAAILLTAALFVGCSEPRPIQSYPNMLTIDPTYESLCVNTVVNRAYVQKYTNINYIEHRAIVVCNSGMLYDYLEFDRKHNRFGVIDGSYTSNDGYKFNILKLAEKRVSQIESLLSKGKTLIEAVYPNSYHGRKTK